MAKRDQAQKIVREVAARLKAARLEKGYSLRQLAALSGISATGITNIEEGHRTPTLFSLLNLAHALDISVSSLLEDLEP